MSTSEWCNHRCMPLGMHAPRVVPLGSSAHPLDFVTSKCRITRHTTRHATRRTPRMHTLAARVPHPYECAIFLVCSHPPLPTHHTHGTTSMVPHPPIPTHPHPPTPHPSHGTTKAHQHRHALCSAPPSLLGASAPGATGRCGRMSCSQSVLLLGVFSCALVQSSRDMDSVLPYGDALAFPLCASRAWRIPGKSPAEIPTDRAGGTHAGRVRVLWMAPSGTGFVGSAGCICVD